MIKIKNKIARIKHKVNEYFLMEKSIGILSNTMRRFYIFSVGFDEIYYGIKNSKRFRWCILFCIINWMNAIWHFLFLISDEMWSLIDGPFLPDHLRACVFLLGLVIFFNSVLKTDFLLGEINGNLDTLKMFYILSINLKSIHQLTEKNYKRLAILSRIIITILLNYGATFFIILLPALILMLSILSKKVYILIHFILFTAPYISLIITLSTSGCLIYIYFPYYKMRFDQLNQQIKSIIPNGKRKIILNSKEKLLLQLINEHNLLSLEIHKMNLLIRRTAAFLFICFGLFKVITIYLSIFMIHTFTRILAINAFIIFFILGFGISTLFSLQINSAKNSYKIIHSVVCNCRMRLQLKLKVN